MPCRGVKGKQNRCVEAQLRLGARLCPSPKGCPEGARAQTRPKAEEFFLCPTLQRAEARKAVISSLGVFQPRHFFGRSFTYRSILCSSYSPISANDEPFG